MHNKLQTEITLSTTELELLVLSMTTRDLIPLHRLLHEIHQHACIDLPLDDHYYETRTSTLKHSKVFEDNASCIVLATSNQHCPGAKNITSKWHHFHDQINKG
jgi:hypothetical protein